MTKVIYLSACDFRLLVDDLVEMYFEDHTEPSYEEFVQYCQAQFDDILDIEGVDGIVTYQGGNVVEIWTPHDFGLAVREEISPKVFENLRV